MSNVSRRDFLIGSAGAVSVAALAGMPAMAEGAPASYADSVAEAKECDVVVVGAGLAGMTAAVQAAASHSASAPTATRSRPSPMRCGSPRPSASPRGRPRSPPCCVKTEACPTSARGSAWQPARPKRTLQGFTRRPASTAGTPSSCSRPPGGRKQRPPAGTGGPWAIPTQADTWDCLTEPQNVDVH